MDWSSSAGFLGGLGDLIYNIVRDQSLTGAQWQQNEWNSSEAQKARDFSAEQAELTRDFNSSEALAQREWSSSEALAQREWSSQEAERARDWQEEMYAKYNSLSGKMSQARAAGVNPMLAVTGSAVSPMTTNSPMPSGSSASGSAASASSPAGAAAGGSASGGVAGALNLAKVFLGFKDIISQIQNRDADTEKKRSEANLTDWQSRLTERQFNVIVENNFDVQEIQSRINLNSEQASAAFQLAGKYFEEAGKADLESQYLYKTMDDRVKIKDYERIMADFEASLPEVVDSLDDKQSEELSDWVGAIIQALLYIK